MLRAYSNPRWIKGMGWFCPLLLRYSLDLSLWQVSDYTLTVLPQLFNDKGHERVEYHTQGSKVSRSWHNDGCLQTSECEAETSAHPPLSPRPIVPKLKLNMYNICCIAALSREQWTRL